jgi:hypothetical protein
MLEAVGGPSIFNRANAFPAAEAIDIPLSDEALRLYKLGLAFLHDYFPFWMAALIGKLIISRESPVRVAPHTIAP